jgi:hypothetical protein
MTYLLDVNLLIALCDPYHVHHEAAHRWFGSANGHAWATCPMTENAFIRITSKNSYPHGPGSSAQQIKLLREFCSLRKHEFWTDAISLLNLELWTELDSVGSSDLTDLYLLALAVKNRGRLATFDRHIPAHLVRGGREALVILPA